MSTAEMYDDPRMAYGQHAARTVTLTNAQTLVVQIRTWADFAGLNDKTKLRNLANRQEQLARELAEIIDA